MDFGGSTVDVVYWNADVIDRIQSYERLEVATQSLDAFVEGVGLDLTDVESIYVTGGKTHAFVKIFNLIPVIRVNEIDAIGWGGAWLLKQEDEQIDQCLVVSMGTGTCMVSFQGAEITHLGGTGVGGGTFQSLCTLLLKENNPECLVSLFKEGDLSRVDLSVGDIVGRGIGRVSSDVTASNLGKVSSSVEEIDFSKADLGAGIANLIGQTIATAAVFAAKSENLETIVFTGKLIRITPIVDIILKVGELYGRKIVVPENGKAVSAIGAACAGMI